MKIINYYLFYNNLLIIYLSVGSLIMLINGTHHEMAPGVGYLKYSLEIRFDLHIPTVTDAYIRLDPTTGLMKMVLAGDEI